MSITRSHVLGLLMLACLTTVFVAAWWIAPSLIANQREASVVSADPHEVEQQEKYQDTVASKLPRLAESNSSGAESTEGEPKPIVEEASSRREEQRYHEEEWRTLYREATVASLLEERNLLNTFIFEETRDEFARRFETGQFEVIGTGKVYTAEDWDRTKICNVRILGEGGIQKVTLPEDEFGELYENKRRVCWIEDELNRRGDGHHMFSDETASEIDH